MSESVRAVGEDEPQGVINGTTGVEHDDAEHDLQKGDDEDEDDEYDEEADYEVRNLLDTCTHASFPLSSHNITLMALHRKRNKLSATKTMRTMRTTKKVTTMTMRVLTAQYVFEKKKTTQRLILSFVNSPNPV